MQVWLISDLYIRHFASVPECAYVTVLLSSSPHEKIQTAFPLCHIPPPPKIVTFTWKLRKIGRVRQAMKNRTHCGSHSVCMPECLRQNT